MRILVTGATGLVGANVVRQLLADGHRVRAGVRATSNRVALSGVQVEEVPLYLERPDTVARAVQGCDAVIHAAATVWIGETGRAAMRRVNVGGTRAVLRAAADAGVRRVVHVSSVDALGLRTLAHPADEDTAPNTAWLRCPYVDTKREAEEVVDRFVDRGLDVVVVNPGFMLGPWDTRPTSGRLLLEIARGRGLLAPPGANCFVDVRDVAWGIARALEVGRRGRRYILGGPNLSWFDAWTWIASVVGGRAPVGIAPRAALVAAGRAGRWWGRIRGREPEVNPVSVRMSMLPHVFDSARAHRELGFPHTDVERAIRDGWAWFVEWGYR